MGIADWSISTIDYHTAGEPFRIVPELPFAIPGSTVLERRQNAATGEADVLRRLLVNEPRGHADMYGGFVVPPDDDGAHLGVLFWHKDGFSTACGHGTIALGAWAVRSGLVPAEPDGVTDVVIDVPSGRVVARVLMAGGEPVSVTFRNVPARVAARDIAANTDYGTVAVDVLWGGALYASVAAADLGLRVAGADLNALIDAGRQIKAALADHPVARHPEDPRLDGIYGTIIFEDVHPVVEDADAAFEDVHADGHPAAPPDGPYGSLAQRNVTIFADGQVDRSPCGSGTSARVAALDSSGRLAPGQTLHHFSIIDTHFTGTVAERAVDGVVVDVVGTAYHVGESRFFLDPDDRLGLGFVLR